MYSFPNQEPIHCSMSGCNCCFLSCIQVSQEADKVVRYCPLFKNFPQFVVSHTVKGFSLASEGDYLGAIDSGSWKSAPWTEAKRPPSLCPAHCGADSLGALDSQAPGISTMDRGKEATSSFLPAQLGGFPLTQFSL